MKAPARTRQAGVVILTEEQKQETPSEKLPKETEPEPQKQRLEPGGFALWPLSAAILFVGVIVDQLTKFWAVAALKPENYPYGGPGRIIVIIPEVFQLRYAENRGAAFSILQGQVGFLTVVSFIVAVVVAIWWTRAPADEKWGRLSLAMILSGAIGNLIDRVFLGYVVDMFDTFIFGYDYPVFNIADSLICVGVVILIVRAWQGKV